jgi:hypothetical protein
MSLFSAGDGANGSQQRGALFLFEQISIDGGGYHTRCCLVT